MEFKLKFYWCVIYCVFVAVVFGEVRTRYGRELHKVECKFFPSQLCQNLRILLLAAYSVLKIGFFYLVSLDNRKDNFLVVSETETLVLRCLPRDLLKCLQYLNYSSKRKRGTLGLQNSCYSYMYRN